MSEELDRKIAELVMGEPEPPRRIYQPVDGRWYLPPIGLEGGVEQIEYWTSKVGSGRSTLLWKPLPFSTDLDLAMRAVDKYLDALGVDDDFNPPLLQTYYDPTAQEEAWTVLLVIWDDEARDWIPEEVITLGHTLPEAICNLLVALVESKSG